MLEISTPLGYNKSHEYTPHERVEGAIPMDKIQMKTPLVEMDGDEMTRILWQQIKEELLAIRAELDALETSGKEPGS